MKNTINKNKDKGKGKNIKKESEEEIKKKEENRKKIIMMIGLIIIGGTFIVAYLSYGPTRMPTSDQNQNDPIDIYSTMNFEAGNIIFVIKNFAYEYGILPTGGRFDWSTLQNIKNISTRGIEKIELEFVRDRGIVFKFKINKTENLSHEEILDDIFNNFKYIINIENKNEIFGIYEGYIYGLPRTEENKVDVFALPLMENKYIIGDLYSRNVSHKKIGIQSNIIEDCDNVSAKVLNVTSINVEGEIYDLSILKKIKNMYDLKVENPKVNITSDESAAIKNLVEKFNPEISKDYQTNITTMKFKNWTISINTTKVNVSNTTINETKILNFEYNLTKAEIEKILNEGNISYEISPGKIKFAVKNEDWNDNVYNNIKNYITNLKVEKRGNVKVANVCTAEKKLLAIPNNENFNAILNLDTKEGDIINVAIAYYSIAGGWEDRLVPHVAIENA